MCVSVGEVLASGRGVRNVEDEDAPAANPFLLFKVAPWKDTAIPQRSHTLIITSLRLVHTVHDLLGIHHTSARGRAKDDDVRPGRLLPPPPTDTRTRKMAKSCGQKLWQLVS
jgi:hypothetical protein